MRVVFGIDVSKASSEVAVVIDMKRIKLFEIENNRPGFNLLGQELSAFENPEIIFEATGVYSNRLCRFLNDNNYVYTCLNPLEAKKQLDSLRKRKTDANDAWRLAETQFRFSRPTSHAVSPIYSELLILSRHYDQISCDLVKCKNRIHRSLQNTFPEIEMVVDKKDTTFYWNIIELFAHPDLVTSLTLNEVFLKLQQISTHHAKSWLLKKAKYIQDLAGITYPVCDVTSSEVNQIQYLADQAVQLIKRKDMLIKRMAKLAENYPDLEIIKSIPGIGEKTAVLLMGELGDLHRFKGSSKLNAFVGIDIRHYQSGDSVAPDRISKLGNAHARKVLYQSVMSIASVKSPCHIKDFYKHKKQSSSSTKKTAIATMQRLLRTIYHLVLNNQMYNYEIAKGR